MARTNSVIAEELLTAKEKAKAASDTVTALKKELDLAMNDGEQVTVRGQLYQWTVSIGKSPAYKKAIDWVHARVTVDVQTLLEESVAVTMGKRTTKDLKAVE